VNATWLEARFERIFMLETGFVTLDRLLKRLHKNKPELLMVLDRERRGPQGMIRLRYRCVFQRRWGPEIYAGKVRLDFDLNLHSIVMDQAKESSKHMMCRSYMYRMQIIQRLTSPTG
jgi:hypothetical protein